MNSFSTLQFAPAPARPAPQLLLEEAIAALAGRRYREAWERGQQVLRADPANAPAHNLAGLILHLTERTAEALPWLERAIALDPRESAYRNNLSVALCDEGRLEEAVAAAEQAQALAPHGAEARCNLARVYLRQGRIEDSIALLQEALKSAPENATAFRQLGDAWWEKHDLPQAVAAFERAAALEPARAENWNNLGYARYHAGEALPAIACFEKALALEPANGLWHTNLAYALLLLGDYRRGLSEYEWRPEHPRNRTRPVWDGRPLGGAPLLLAAEQGFGDTLMCSRYLAWVREKGARITLAVHPELLTLFAANFEDCEVIPWAESMPVPGVWFPLLSLPLLCGTTPETIPPAEPPLRADPAKAARWRERLAPAARRRVGLAWRGRPTHPQDRWRSVALAAFAPILACPGLTFHSLQCDDRGEAAGREQVLDHSAELADFAETAALIAELDLVIAVDTAVVHLAAAMKKPVWVLLPFVPDWRWMLGRADTPWYPQVRLFRQKAAGAWEEVFTEVAAALAAWRSPGLC